MQTVGQLLIALAIPVFFLFIGIELLVAWRTRRPVYRLGDSLSDLSAGITQQVSQIFTAAALLAGYAFVYEKAALVRFEKGSWIPWAIAIVGVDFTYYWWHRLSHEVNGLWAAHVVHHQSEDYNFAVALRQSAFTSFTIWPFNLWMALAGVPPLVFATLGALSTLYQFWLHTELVPPLPRVETVLNTPALHRVHHAINPRYLDKNYGATFMVWDRLFGTYVPETEPCVYGITRPLRSFNPLWAQVHYWVDLFRTSARAPTLGDAVRVWLRSPSWHADWMGERPAYPATVSREAWRKYDPAFSSRLGWYVGLHFAAVIAGTFSLLMWRSGLSTAWVAAAAVAIFVSLLSLVALIERRPYAPALEGARLVGLVVLGVWAL